MCLCLRDVWCVVGIGALVNCEVIFSTGRNVETYKIQVMTLRADEEVVLKAAAQKAVLMQHASARIYRPTRAVPL